MRSSPARLSFVAFILFASTLVAQAPQNVDQDERIRALEEQNRRLEAQYREVIDRLDATEAKNRDLESRLQDANSDETRARLEELIGKLGDAADGNVVTNSRLTRSASPIQFYGRIRLDSYYNTARMNTLIVPRWVQPEDGVNAAENDDAFALDARLTTVGLDLDAGRIGSAHVGGKIEFDFANFDTDLPESRESLRLLLAYIDIEFDHFSLRVGQDWDIIAPYDPLVDEQSHLWDTGNLGDRRPMIALTHSGGQHSGLEYSISLAAGLTGSVDNADEDLFQGQFLTTERDGFDAGTPHGQLSASVTFPTWVEGTKGTFGIFGLLGELETDAAFGGKTDFTTYAVGVDLWLPLIDRVHMKGEVFFGQALADFRGGISQSINQIDGDEVQSIGGWGEVYWQVCDVFGFGVGGAIDNPEFGDLEEGDRASNWTIYLATRFDWGDGLTSGFDVLFWKTEYVNREEGDTLRFNAFVQVAF